MTVDFWFLLWFALGSFAVGVLITLWTVNFLWRVANKSIRSTRRR